MLETRLTVREPESMVSTFDFPYMKAGRRMPPRAETLTSSMREAVEEGLSAYGRAFHGKRPRGIVLAGKSMGSRVATHLASELGPAPAVQSVPIVAVVAFGYPLIGQGGGFRDAVLRTCPVPILFCQGDCDPMCPLAELEKVRASGDGRLKDSRVFVVVGGDHSLQVRKGVLKTQGLAQEGIDEDVLLRVVDFASVCVDPSTSRGDFGPDLLLSTRSKSLAASASTDPDPERAAPAARSSRKDFFAGFKRGMPADSSSSSGAAAGGGGGGDGAAATAPKKPIVAKPQ